MANNKLNGRLQQAAYTAAELTSANPVLLAKEIAYESDTGKMKIGDGVAAWNSLPYFGAEYATPESVKTAVSAAVEVEKTRAEGVETELAGQIDGMGGGGKSFVLAEGTSGRCLLLTSESDSTRARIMMMWSDTANTSSPGSYLVTFTTPGLVIPHDLSPSKVDELMDYVKQNVDLGDGNPPATPIGFATVFFDALTLDYMMQMIVSNFATKDEVSQIGKCVDVSGWTGELLTGYGQITEDWQLGAVYLIYYGVIRSAGGRSNFAHVFTYPIIKYIYSSNYHIPMISSNSSGSSIYTLWGFDGKIFNFTGDVLYRIYRIK